jgi:hypothetical protein
MEKLINNAFQLVPITMETPCNLTSSTQPQLYPLVEEGECKKQKLYY